MEQRGPADEGDGRPLDFQHQIRERRLAKLDALRQRGVEPYPVRFDRDCTAAELHGQYRDLAPGIDTGRAVRLAGRLLAQRRHGGLDFGDLRDETGVIQLMISRDHVGDQAMRDFSELDLGDWIGASGTVATSEHGELSIRVDSFELLSKSLRALPSVHDGITDPEARYRQRYLDLTLNESTRRTFAIRSAVIACHAPSAHRAGLHRGGDAGAAGSGRRGRRPPVHYAPQRAGHRHDPADRARAAAQAADRRRHEPRLRDRPRVSQRGSRHPSQPRVHAARGLPGVRGLPRHDGADRGDRGDGRDRGDRVRPWSASPGARSTSSRPGGGSRWPS